MVRIIIKGGVWKNTEDEVLKAAIAKYGKNQWARISSLLVRKTPKQCKARWYEWLDPSIKKTEWSKTEDEKLLHLAKLMPTQWRTIAPIVGRTATQCLERYQKLLDEAEAKENEELGLAGPEGDAGPSADDIRRLRPGEIDPDPETKPARPDPIDMDEDEKEMLSEARARLANTQGKKAKRKARERQLEEARRLAVLQKKRELKAAGIIMRHKSKKRGMDYNADIPFEKKPAAGFYDVSDENAKVTSAPVGQTLRRLDNKRKPEEEEAERKKRQRKADDGKQGGGDGHSTKFVAARDAQIQKLKEAEQISRRTKLNLPTPQVGEAELEEIAKIAQVGQTARALVSDEGAGSEASGRLLAEYESLSHASTARTPRTAPQHDNVMAEARNLLNMTNAQTPLLGDENTPLHLPSGGGTGFEGATPHHQVAFTPNPLATPLRRPGDPSATPGGANGGVGATPLRTPMRDSLSINAEDGASVVGGTPREQRMRVDASRRALKVGFSSLPAPRNDFEIMMPEEEEQEESTEPLTEEDAAERDARNKKWREEEERKALARRSAPVRNKLPRPVNVNSHQLAAIFSALRQQEQEDSPTQDHSFVVARQLIDREMIDLLEHDTIAHPLPGTSKPGGTLSHYDMPGDDFVAEAKQLVHFELATSIGFPNANEEQTRQGITVLAAEEGVDLEEHGWAKARESLAYSAGSRSWVDPASLSSEERVAGLTALLEIDQDSMAKEAAKTAKLEKKMGVVLGGYQVRFNVLAKRIHDGFSELQKTDIDLQSFGQLSIAESAGGPRRLDSLKEEVDVLERRERNLQTRYQHLSEDRREIFQRISEKEEQLMGDAEAMNEAAMAEMEAAEETMADVS